MTVTGPVKVGRVEFMDTPQALFGNILSAPYCEGISIERIQDNTIAISTGQKLYTTTDGGVTWSSPNTVAWGRPASSLRGIPTLVQRINSRDGSPLAVTKLKVSGSGFQLWNYHTIQFSTSGASLGAVTIRTTTPRSFLILGVDNINNVVSEFFYGSTSPREFTSPFSPTLEYAKLDPEGISKSSDLRDSARVTHDPSIYARSVNSPQVSNNLVGGLLGFLAGVYCTTMDGWHQKPNSNTAFTFVFDRAIQNTVRVSADPNRLDFPVGPKITGQWLQLGGANPSSGLNPSVTNSQAWQVRHCMSGDRLYRFVRKGGNTGWQFDDIEAFGFSSISRETLNTPAGGWMSPADTRFVPTPQGVIAVHLSEVKCIVSYWNKNSELWSAWETVYENRQRGILRRPVNTRSFDAQRSSASVNFPTNRNYNSSNKFPQPAGCGVVRSSPGEYVDIAVFQRDSSRDSAGMANPNSIYYYRWAADLPPDTPSIISPGNGEIKNLSETLNIVWNYSDASGNTQSAYRLRRTIGTETRYWKASTGSWESGEIENSRTQSNVTVAAGWGPGPGNVSFEVAVKNSEGAWSGYSDLITVYGDRAGPVSHMFAGRWPNVEWRFPANSSPQSFRVRVYRGNDLIYNSGRLNIDDLTDRSGTKVFNTRYSIANGSYRLEVVWWSSSGLESSASSINFRSALSLPYRPNTRSIAVVDSVVVSYTATFLRVGGRPNAVAVEFYKRLKRDPSIEWKATANVTLDDRAEANGYISRAILKDEFVKSGEEYQYSLHILGANYSRYIDSWRDAPIVELDTVRLTKVDGTETRSFRGSSMSGSISANISTAPFADGSQKSIYGYDVVNPIEIKFSSLSLSDKEWLENNVGLTYVLRLPIGTLDKVLIGDVRFDHDARHGDDDSTGPLRGSMLLVPLVETVNL